MLMKSRYSAYVVGLSHHIIRTTHPDNPEYDADIKAWGRSIETFSRNTLFLGLEIQAYHERGKEAYVTFVAEMDSGKMRERSRFVCEDGVWLYVDGEVAGG